MDDETLGALASISVATITMQLLKRGIRNISMAGVRPLNTPAEPILGPAFTLRYVPLREDLSTPDKLGGDDYPPRLAIEQAPEGGVLVIDGRGRGDIAVVGDLLVERLKIRGVVGVVSDGGVRDCEDALAVGLALYASGPAAPASVAVSRSYTASTPRSRSHGPRRDTCSDAATRPCFATMPTRWTVMRVDEGGTRRCPSAR